MSIRKRRSRKSLHLVHLVKKNQRQLMFVAMCVVTILALLVIWTQLQHW